MDGISILEAGRARAPKSKAEISRMLTSDPDNVLVSGLLYSGPISCAPDGEYTFTGKGSGPKGTGKVVVTSIKEFKVT